VEQALSDIEDYYAAGSLANALMDIAGTITSAAPPATATPGVVKKVK
jgi:hypothetical protein